MAPAVRPLGLVLLVTLAGCARAPRPGPARAPRPDLTVMTYNVNFGLAGDDATLQAIRREGADVVLLQETNEAWQADIEERLSGIYPTRRYHHCCRAGGLAVLSRFDVGDLGVLPARHGWFPAWRVVVRSPTGPVQILSVHLRPAVSDSGGVVSGAFTTPRVRRAEIEDFYGLVDRSLPTLVVGDLNEGPNGHAVEFLQAQGLTNVLPEAGGPQSTWHWRTSVGTLRLQLDHIFCNGLLRPLWAHVVHAGHSDHYPVVAAFARRG